MTETVHIEKPRIVETMFASTQYAWVWLVLRLDDFEERKRMLDDARGTPR